MDSNIRHPGAPSIITLNVMGVDTLIRGQGKIDHLMLIQETCSNYIYFRKANFRTRKVTGDKVRHYRMTNIYVPNKVTKYMRQIWSNWKKRERQIHYIKMCLETSKPFFSNCYMNQVKNHRGYSWFEWHHESVLSNWHL